MIVYEHEITVRPDLPWRDFPLDQMRYDHVAPKRTEDATAIQDRVDDSYNLGVEERERVDIVLTRWAEKSWEPERRRWESFGWHVINHDKRKVG